VSAQRSPERARLVVENWRAKPDRSVTSQIGSSLLNGEWLTSHDVDEQWGGASNSMLAQVVSTLRLAGEHVVERDAGPNGLHAYSVSSSQLVQRESAGVTHPQLGAVLTVRALVLDESGDLIVSLSNGSQAWSAKITGHVS
jgi:hypothetical protein